jgi:single-strand DNA-binding protein
MLPQINGEFGVVQDPELRFRGKAVSRKQVNGEWVDGDICFIDILCFQKLAENVTESITKGSTITVTGNLQMREWEDNEGRKQKAYSISATSIGVTPRFSPVKATELRTVEVLTAPQSENPPF